MTPQIPTADARKMVPSSTQPGVPRLSVHVTTSGAALAPSEKPVLRSEFGQALLGGPVSGQVR
ncbi:MAG TPA: hypothetical protein VGO88_08600 [Mycetocola sp.]|nr:hypothetical protein [Mycetocola sp.]